MRINRFFGDFDFKQKTLQISDRDFLHQIKDVLRLKMGDKIILCSQQVPLIFAMAKINGSGKDMVEVEILEVGQNQNEPAKKVILYCAILKRENFELVAQKATEVGVSEIVPLICARTIKTGLKYDRLQKIIKEAAEQSGRGIVPKLREVINFEEAIRDAKNNEINFLFDLAGAKFVISDITNLAPNSRAGIFIGPEGGWDEKEIILAKNNKIKICSLGKLTLRAETAAIVATHKTCNG